MIQTGYVPKMRNDLSDDVLMDGWMDGWMDGLISTDNIRVALNQKLNVNNKTKIK